MNEELLQALAASGLAYDMINGYNCSPEEADDIIYQIY